MRYAEEASESTPAALHVLISLCARCHTTRELDTALGNRTLRTQPTDYSLICGQILE